MKGERMKKFIAAVVVVALVVVTVIGINGCGSEYMKKSYSDFNTQQDPYYYWNHFSNVTIKGKNIYVGMLQTEMTQLIGAPEDSMPRPNSVSEYLFKYGLYTIIAKNGVISRIVSEKQNP
ncbi:MAG: hypothetical protein ACLPSL_14000 [Smithella sp.]